MLIYTACRFSQPGWENKDIAGRALLQAINIFAERFRPPGGRNQAGRKHRGEGYILGQWLGSAVGSWQLAVGSWQLAVGSWQLAVW